MRRFHVQRPYRELVTVDAEQIKFTAHHIVFLNGTSMQSRLVLAVPADRTEVREVAGSSGLRCLACQKIFRERVSMQCPDCGNMRLGGWGEPVFVPKEN